MDGINSVLSAFSELDPPCLGRCRSILSSPGHRTSRIQIKPRSALLFSNVDIPTLTDYLARKARVNYSLAARPRKSNRGWHTAIESMTYAKLLPKPASLSCSLENG